MSFPRRLIVALSAAGLAALAAYAYFAHRAAPGPQPAGPDGGGAGASAAAVMVETAPVVAQAMHEDVSAVGTLKSNESVVLRPEIAGRIAAIRFDDGTPVKKGALLVQLDASTQRAELAQAQASLALAQTNFRRTEDLFEKKFVSGSARDEAAANLKVAQANTELLQARLRKTDIVAPFSGIVGIRNVSVGDYVKEGDDLVNLEDIASLKVDFRLPELYLERIRAGQSLEVTSDALPGRRFKAAVDAIDPLVDAQGRAVLLRARLDNRERLLRPGMFARVRLILAERPSVPVVPEQALVPTGDGQSLFVVEDGKARLATVRTGIRRGTRVEILEGVQVGDMVVTAGQLKLRDGAPVQVVDGGADGAAQVSSR